MGEGLGYMGSGINNKINEFLCKSKNVKKRRNKRLEKCYGHVNIATAFHFALHIGSYVFGMPKYIYMASMLTLKSNDRGKIVNIVTKNSSPIPSALHNYVMCIRHVLQCLNFAKFSWANLQLLFWTAKGKF